MPNIELLSIGSAVAWGGLWTNVVLIPFYNKGEKLHQDYKEKGSLDNALAGIDSRKLIPALATLFQRAREAQVDKRQKMDIEVLVQLFQSVDFLPDLKEIEAALQEKRSMEDAYRRLHSLAQKLWKWGLAHVFLTLFFAVAWFDWAADSNWLPATRALLGGLWFVSLGFMIHGFWRFHRYMTSFIDSLGHGGPE